MNLFCIVFCTILIATADAKPSKTDQSTADDSTDYYDEISEEQLDNNSDDPVPLDQNDARVSPKFLMKPEVVVAKQGESAVLKCPTENTENYGLVWLKGKKSIAQGTLSLNKTLYEIQKDNSLIVKNVQPESLGYYSCVIAISGTNTISLTHRLKLENGAEILSLYAEGNNTQLRTGDTLILTCEVDGKPLPTIRWFFDNNDPMGAIEISKEKRQSAVSKDTIIIKDVSFSNNGTYRCLAQNQLTVDHRTIVIEVFDLPIYLEIEKHYGSNSELNILDCFVKYSSSKILQLSWKKINNLRFNYLQDKTNISAKLYFNEIKESDFGMYVCSARSSDGVIEKTVEVSPPARPFFDKFFAGDGYNITLAWRVLSFYPIISCLVYDLEQDKFWPIPNIPAHVQQNGRDFYSIFHTQQFFAKEHTGFSIACQNAVGWSEVSKIQTFEVTDSHLYIEIEKIYQHNDLIGLNCLLLLNMTEVELSWKKYNHNIKSINVDTSLERTSRSLTLLFSDSNFLNSGVYLCTAKNIGLKGLIQKRIHIQPPSKPTNLAGNYTSSMEWNIHSDLLITECKVLYREANTCGHFGNSDRRLNIREQEYYSYIITYKRPGNLNGQYEFILICKNEDGWSESSNIQTIDLGVAPIMRIEKMYSKTKLLIGFNCVVIANPFAHIFWKRDNTIIRSNHTFQKTNNSLKLIFNNPTESDLGQYTCAAINNEGSTEKDIMFSKPLQPQFRGFQSLGNSKREVLTWTVRSHEPLKLCMVYYTGENETRQSIAATEIRSDEDGFVIMYTPEVPNGGTYKFRIKCLSEAGWSDESQERTLDVTDKGRDSATSDSQVSRGLRLLPSLLLFTATAILLNQ